MDTTVAITADYDNGYDDDYNSYLVWVFFIYRLTEAHKTAIRVLRKIKYFVARRKFQVWFY